MLYEILLFFFLSTAWETGLWLEVRCFKCRWVVLLVFGQWKIHVLGFNGVVCCRMLTAVAHNHLFSVKTEDLSDTLPSLQEVQLSYTKFKQFFLIGESALLQINAHVLHFLVFRLERFLVNVWLRLVYLVGEQICLAFWLLVHHIQLGTVPSLLSYFMYNSAKPK